MKQNKLIGDYKITYLDILSYLQSSNILPNDNFFIEVKQDMKDMLLSAQISNLPITDIVGNDLKSFCEDIIKSYNNKKIKILNVLKHLNFSLAILTLFSILFEISLNHFYTSTLIIFFLTWFGFKYILNFCYKKLCLRFKGLKNKILVISLISICSTFLLFPLTLLTSQYFTLSLNGYYVSLTCLILVFVLHIICKKLDRHIKWYSYLN